MHYHDITKDDMKNGTGLRAVLWLSGCEHACPFCQNPVTWNPDDGLVFDTRAKSELFSLLDRDYISGVTFSGGDPLFLGNRAEVTELIKEIKEKYTDKTIWLYTGYTWEEIKDLELIGYIDVLVDGRYENDKRDIKLKWRGSTNQRVIDVNKSLNENSLVLFCD